MAIVVAILASAAVAGPASTGTPLAGYCSPSGDLCYGVMRLDDGRILLQLDTIERYFARYTLCVTPPRGPARCRRFSVARLGKIYGSRIVLERSFGMTSRGAYRATWTLERRLGPTLRFRR